MIAPTLTLLCPPPRCPLVWGQDTHVTGRDDAITPSAHHGLPDLDEPPVRFGARGVAHYGLQALLEHFSDGTVGWGESSRAGSQPVCEPLLSLSSGLQPAGAGVYRRLREPSVCPSLGWLKSLGHSPLGTMCL